SASVEGEEGAQPRTRTNRMAIGRACAQAPGYGRDMKGESLVDPAIEQPLLSLHRATNVDSLWTAPQQLLSAVSPNCLIRLAFQRIAVLPATVRKARQPVPNTFLAAEPLKSHVAGKPRKRFVRISDLFSSRKHLTKSPLYRCYLAPQNCQHGAVLLFWKG